MVLMVTSLSTRSPDVHTPAQERPRPARRCPTPRSPLPSPAKIEPSTARISRAGGTMSRMTRPTSLSSIALWSCASGVFSGRACRRPNVDHVQAPQDQPRENGTHEQVSHRDAELIAHDDEHDAGRDKYPQTASGCHGTERQRLVIFWFSITGTDITPSRTTDAPMMPVEAARMMPISVTVIASPPRTLPNSFCIECIMRSATPDCPASAP